MEGKMPTTIIFDYMGIIADPDYLKLIWDMPLPNKYAALRIFVGMKKHPEIKEAFRQYQKGTIDRNGLHDVAAEFYPKSAHVVNELLDKLPSYVTVNNKVIELARSLRESGIRTFIMSNAIPETEETMKGLNLDGAFEGIILSNKIGAKKPSRKIFTYAFETYGIDPGQTVLIDDTKKNLRAAEALGITPLHCKNSTETCEELTTLFSDILSTRVVESEVEVLK